MPTTITPTTNAPTTANPTTYQPTTYNPTTYQPTTSTPTAIPTSIPTTISPTADPTRINTFPGVIRAIFINSYLEIHINLNVTAINPLRLSCDNIFDITTNHLLRGATCSWNSLLKKIVIYLASSCVVDINDILTINNNTFEWSNDNAMFFILNDNLSFNVLPSFNPNYPLISFINQPLKEIGICDSLRLDASATTNLGGRAPARIQWHIMISNTTYKFNDTFVIEIDSDDIRPGWNVTYEVSITSWYGIKSVYQSEVISKSYEPVPQLYLSGPTIFDAFTNEIQIDAFISFIDSCLNTNKMLSLRYIWSIYVASNITLSSIQLDNVKYNKLVSFLFTQTNNYLIFDSNKYLQKGINYIFQLDIECVDGYYDCFVSDKLYLSYQYSPIECQISGGNKIIDLQISEIHLLNIELIGNEWTIDHDGNELVYKWECSIYGNNCDDIIISPSLPSEIIEIVVDQNVVLTVNETYNYQFTLIVQDINIATRDVCESIIELTLNVIEDNAADAIIVSISSTSTTINVYDRLRLIGGVKYIDGTDVPDNILNQLNYEWSEVTNKLSNSQIFDYRVNGPNSIYLILQKNTLQSGNFYEFQLYVYSNDNTMNIQSATASILIYVNSPPLITENSMQINPGCNVFFNSLVESLQYFVHVSIQAEGDYIPLLYQFDASLNEDEIIYLHSYRLSEPYLNNIILPINCNFSVTAHVTDFEGATASDSIECCTEVLISDNDDNCFSYQHDIIDAFFENTELKTDSENNRYIFQTSINVLHFFPNIKDKECILNHLKEIINVLISHYESSFFNFCDSNNFLVIHLSQTLWIWFDMAIKMDNGEHIKELFETSNNIDYFALIYDLLTQSLDGCITLREIESMNDLDVSLTESIITNKVIVLLNDIDITSKLSIMLTNADNFHLLYNLINDLVTFLSFYSQMDSDIILSSDVSIKTMVLFIEKVLYLSGLASISTSIPTEVFNITFDNFELFTIRK
eukprot:264603_1